MEKQELKEELNELKEELKEIEILKEYGVDIEDFDTVEELKEELKEHIEGEEIIYYHNAMNYLRENDPSLMESIEIANELGYTTDELNSELLATLLYQQEKKEELEKEFDKWEGELLEYYEKKQELEILDNIE